MKCLLFALTVLLAVSHSVSAADEGALLRDHILKSYPSLLYVDKYRVSFPNEIQGTTPFWSAGTPPSLAQPDDLIAALAQLQDPHVSLVGKRAGKSETLGVLFRTASDGNMIVWRAFDQPNLRVRVGDRVLAIDGVPTRAWLQRAAALTFGGNRRGRYAEAALDLGLGTAIVHRTAHLGSAPRLLVQGNGATRLVTLMYRPMNPQRALALTAALNQPDLPTTIASHGRRIGTLRIGAFAPQYDSVFLAADDAASKKPGITDDQAMQAGYCAVTAAFIKRYDSLAHQSDVMVLDLRGNLGGFDREARLEAGAIAPAIPPRTFDLFATGRSGIVRLAQQTVDPSCGHVTSRRPIVVLVDAGTRSSGELMAAWLWSSGATIAGEQTAGADGGLDSEAKGFPLPISGFNVRMSGNFTIFDPALQLNEGDWPERTIVAQVAANHFGLSRVHPFAFQSVGLRPDIRTATTLSDLNDNGVAEVIRILDKCRLMEHP
jgi:hypothetical protein